MSNEYKLKYIRELDKCVKEHRYIMEQHLNRELSIYEIVHHKDGNKRNNKIENLEILTREEHASLHFAGSKRRKNKMVQ